MLLKTVRTEFYDQLADHYPQTEIESLFYLLTEHIMKLKRIDVSQHLFKVVSGKKYDKYRMALRHLEQKKPIQYYFGHTEFYGLQFFVNPHVLIPRQETEELVAFIIKDHQAVTQPIKILDVGTGSGCIAVSLAKHLPHAEVHALDISTEALKVASKNAKSNDVTIHFMHIDILHDAQWENDFSNTSFDVIISNPPYVREQEKKLMHANVLDHEPHTALFVEDDNPLKFYDAISRFATKFLNSNGTLYFEINENLGIETSALLSHYDFNSVELKKDICGKDRMLKARNK